MYKIIRHLLDNNEKQEKKIKVIKIGVLIAGVTTAIGIGFTILNTKKHPHFVKRRIKMEEVGNFKPRKNRIQKINIIEED